jgi:hypothetical protein
MALRAEGPGSTGSRWGLPTEHVWLDFLKLAHMHGSLARSPSMAPQHHARTGTEALLKSSCAACRR